jgi:hypothetical protein
VFLDECGELGTGKVLEQLIEEARDLYDCVALLWAAFGETPSKESLANVNYRRALLLFQTAETCFGQGWSSIGCSNGSTVEAKRGA